MNTETTAIGTKKTTRSSVIWGILMFVCGILAIALPRISSIEIVIILSWLILIAGVWHLIFAFHAHSAGGFLWQILLAALYGVAGVYMWMNPLISVVSLTLVLAAFLALEGIIEIALYFGLRGRKHAGWVLLDGIVTLILGILIWKQWPSSSTWVIGTLVGISLMFSGISRFLLAGAARGASPASA
ncbi:MAG: HdeD family acid-resistance protein [Chthoniobacteraceae bacterium]